MPDLVSKIQVTATKVDLIETLEYLGEFEENHLKEGRTWCLGIYCTVLMLV